LLRLLFDIETVGYIFLLNVGYHPNYTASKCRRIYTSITYLNVSEPELQSIFHNHLKTKMRFRFEKFNKPRNRRRVEKIA
jgi:hypothetical protein